jgi:hypothetical protein
MWNRLATQRRAKLISSDNLIYKVLFLPISRISSIESFSPAQIAEKKPNCF